MNKKLFSRFLSFFLIFGFFPWIAFSASSEVFYNTSFQLIIILSLAKIGHALIGKIKLPGMIGEICAGILLGNLSLLGISLPALSSIQSSPVLPLLSEFGVVFLLFLVGLESNLTQLVKAGRDSFITATLGVVIPMALGAGLAHFISSAPLPKSLLIGATFAATSVGITAKLLSDAKVLSKPSSQIILGAAVIDDVLGLIILSLISGIISTGSLEPLSLLIIIAKTLGFFFTAFIIGHKILPHYFNLHTTKSDTSLLVALSVIAVLVFSNLAILAGLAPIIGSFTAGLLLDDLKFKSNHLKVHTIEEMCKPLTDFFLPIFFVLIGLQINLITLVSIKNVGLILILLVFSIFGKAVSAIFCNQKNIDRMGIGFGMIPRGEVGLIFATFGLHHNILTSEVYSILVFVVLLTTVIGPLLLKTRLKNF